MGVLTAGDVAMMRGIQADLYHDTCKIGVHTEAANSYGEPVPTWTYGTSLSCGFGPTGGRESNRDDGTILVTDAAVRLPLDTTITTKDKVQITHRHGEELDTALIFGVAALPKRGPSGLVVLLKAVS